MNIGLDLDDVLAAFQISWLKYYNKIYDTNYQFVDVTSYDFSVVFKKDTNEVMERVHEFYNTEEFENLLPVEGSVEGIDKINGNNLYVITSRKSNLQTITTSWLEKTFGNVFSDIILTNQFSDSKTDKPITKSEVAKKLKLDFMVEDAVHYAEDIAAKGISVFLLDKPWNKSHAGNKKITRVKNWDELVISL